MTDDVWGHDLQHEQLSTAMKKAKMFVVWASEKHPVVSVSDSGLCLMKDIHPVVVR